MSDDDVETQPDNISPDLTKNPIWRGFVQGLDDLNNHIQRIESSLHSLNEQIEQLEQIQNELDQEPDEA